MKAKNLESISYEETKKFAFKYVFENILYLSLDSVELAKLCLVNKHFNNLVKSQNNSKKPAIDQSKQLYSLLKQSKKVINDLQNDTDVDDSDFKDIVINMPELSPTDIQEAQQFFAEAKIGYVTKILFQLFDTNNKSVQSTCSVLFYVGIYSSPMWLYALLAKQITLGGLLAIGLLGSIPLGIVCVLAHIKCLDRCETEAKKYDALKENPDNYLNRLFSFKGNNNSPVDNEDSFSNENAALLND